MPDDMMPTAPDDDFEGNKSRHQAEALTVDVDGFEGPLDLLLALARMQKVDLRRVSLLALAEQYLGFVERAKRLRIELAADYLVMAAWLAFLKSRLLLPQGPGDEGPSGEQLAAQMAFRLERLEAMRQSAAKLMARDRKGKDFFVRGIAGDHSARRRITYTASILDLMQAYAWLNTKSRFKPLHNMRERTLVFTMEEALNRMKAMIGQAIDWVCMSSFIPDRAGHPQGLRSTTASTFAAALELVKAGKLEIRQAGTFAPIELRAKDVRQ